MVSEEDRRIENAKWGVGLAALLGSQKNNFDKTLNCNFAGGLFVARKIFKK